ncbi:hypothetical protein [Phenylobacterium sp.]|uniref:hypothetical protein n=1 Tax=Phenylobacterium sp. TaxID=1871053 RepID=UPI00273483E3|nr:hypothetical protein [Phenylobacterium sp.]MDP3855565.1 hypothetical protein [Phenylobacterium sp.]
MDLEATKRRLKVMVAIDAVCAIVAAAAAYGAFGRGVDWLVYVFVAALIAGLAAQIWFIAGVRSANKGV